MTDIHNLDTTPSQYHDHEAQQVYIEKVERDIDTLLGELVKGDLDQAQCVKNLGSLLANYPVTLLISRVNTLNILQLFKGILISYCKPLLQEHANKFLDAEAQNLETHLTEGDWFFLSLLYAKDPLSALHCVETFILAIYVLNTHELEVVQRLDAAQQQILLAAAVRHDIGKVQVPNIALLNPFPRDQQPTIWLGNVRDKKRKRVLAVPAGMENLYPDIIRNPINDETKITEFMSAFENFGGNFREVPLRYVLKVARYLLKFDSFPEEIAALLGNQVVTPKIIQILQNQREALENVDAIFSLYKLDGWDMTFMDTLALHEIASVLILFEIFEKLQPQERESWIRMMQAVGDHHGYDYTKRKLAKDRRWNAEPVHGKDRELINLLRLMDVVAALSQKGRSYRAESLTVDDIQKIINQEAQGGKLDPRMVKNFAAILLQGNQDETDIFNLIRENSLKY